MPAVEKNNKTNILILTIYDCMAEGVLAMYELTHDQAQSIVDKMMKDIPYNINIMDKAGVIIGSGNKERIGTLHKGAANAIEKKKVVETKADTKFEKKGINLPIEIHDEIVGVVGISGEVKEVKPFAKIVRSTVILLIEQSVALEAANREISEKQEFFQLMIHPETKYTNEIIQKAQNYNINLNEPTQIIYFEFPYETKNENLIMRNFPSFKVSNHSFCIFLQEQLSSIEEEINNNYVDAFISYSKTNDTIAEGYRQATSAIRIMKGLFPKNKRIYYTNYELITDLSVLMIDSIKVDHFVHLLEIDDDLIKTLQVYISCNLNINETANELIIHRNTLTYRLDRIHKITGKDPKNILDLVELIFMLIYRT